MFLSFDVFGELLAIFFLFELLPVPVNLNVLFVTLDHLVLDLVCTLLPRFLLQGAPIVLHFISFCLDLENFLLSSSADLIQIAYSNRK